MESICKKEMRRYLYILLWLVIAPNMVMAQSDRQHIREGNRSYRNGEFVKAESSYRKALAKNDRNAIAMYNLGCAQMRQNNDSVAIETFANVSAMAQDKGIRSRASHNAGTILQHKRQYKEAIEAYKDALRNNPKDDDARYNLVLCKHLLKQQQQQQQQQKNKDNKDQNKQDKNKQQDNKDKQQQNKDENNNKEREQKRQMSRENAEQLLNAAMQQEKETQQKLKKAMQQPSRRKLDKNW